MSLDPTPQPLDHLVLRGEGPANALILREGSLSYDTLNLRIGLLAAWLTTMGLEHGDRVATWLPKNETTCLMPLAAARAGMVHVPINPVLKRAQVAHILADSGAKLLIANRTRLTTLIEGDVPQGCRTLDDDEAMAAWKAGETSLGASSHDPNDLAAILYTSGSTGKPKGVMLSHANMWLGAISVANYLGLESDDKTLCVLPLSFDYGQNQLLSTWAAGGTAVPLDYLMPRDVVKSCVRYGITTLAAVPPLWTQLVEIEWPVEATATMRRLTNSGGALSPALVKQLRGIFPATRIFAMYGLTEAFRSTYLDPDLIDGNPTSIGKAIPFAEILVVNDAGEDAAPGEEGELVHAGPLVAQGYWQDAVRTAERYKPAPAFSTYGGMAVWSGDRVRRDEQGLLYFVGRRDAMIKSSGNRISPAEIEDAATSTGLAAEAVALGIPDPQLGQAILLLVRPAAVPQPEQVVDDLVIAMKRDLPAFMLPKVVELRDEFPKNPNGKIDRALLVAEIEERDA
ncbi:MULTISPECIES: acyl-CoA ligase (AMP-forming), exosortase A system-associated [Pseudomonadota]|jgi:acyl-CoA ligase (AMP-forming) (exosortase A-associated)|uniref:acyl-CoA ligase (AMP-forming), exosortase A system-associated n=1 Tax=Pseudomonadota TaxID=1224 RepID=UPI000769C912|nr:MULTISPECIES: acyl-CoA ligase (AMP-forming), exosortase A system-associated [Pseudomonadota]|tara:strand:+ start:269314 stop:270849 length:1536 start_codon:yes stop_codon:yes gene_type:complete